MARSRSPTPSPQDIVFLDIETVSGVESYDQLNERTQSLRSKKCLSIKKRSHECEGMTDAEIYTQKAGIYAEFGKIVVISVGRIDDEGKTHLHSYYGDDEKLLLQEFGAMLDEHYCDPTCYLCGHNAQEFDIPYLCRRSLVQGLCLPKIMPRHADKPWDTKVLDTMQMWKFGDRKSYTPLDILCNIFNIQTPKSDINGSDVTHVYRHDGDLERIKQYCERDVEALIAVYRKLVC